MIFEESVDYPLIKSIVTHPALRRTLADDFSKAEEWHPVKHETVRYILVRDGEEVIGLFVVVFVTAIMFLIHLMFLPCAWGKRSRQALKEGIEFLWRTSKCQRIIGELTEDNKAPLRAVLDCGFEVWGINKKSVMKGGRLQDMYHVGLSRPA